MKHPSPLLRRLALAAITLAALCVPAAAAAQPLSNVIDQVAGGQLRTNFGAGMGAVFFTTMAITLVTQLSTLFYLAGTFAIIRAGLMLVNSQEEDKLEKAKKTIASAVVAMMLLYLTPRLVDAFYGGITVGNPSVVGGTVLEGYVPAGAAILTMEINGIMNWATVLVVPLCILMIAVSCFRAVSAFGGEDGVQKIRQGVIGVASGLLLFVCHQAVRAAIGVTDGGVATTANPMPIILRGIQVVENVLLMLAVAATAVIIYAGVIMVLNMGNEEVYSKSKTIIGRVMAGLAVIVLNYVIARLAYEIGIGNGGAGVMSFASFA